MSTFVLIEKYTVGAGGTSSVTLGSGGTIPQTYTDLMVKASIRTDFGYTRDDGKITFNNSTTGYSGKYLVGYDSGGTGSGSSSTTVFDAWRVDGGTATTNTFNNVEIYIPNYTSSNYKSFSMDDVTENNSSTSYYLGIMAGLWSNTAAITSIKFSQGNGAIVQYSTFYLYGILKA